MVVWVNTIILGLSVLSVYWIYCIKRNDKAKSAAIVVLQQINDIISNVNDFNESCINNGVIFEQDFFVSTPIIVNNEFKNFSKILLPFFTKDEYEIINNFYQKVSIIARLQNDVKQFSLFSLQSRANNYYQCAYGVCFGMLKENNSEKGVAPINDSIKDLVDKLNQISVPAYIPKQYLTFLQDNLECVNKIDTSSIILKLESISKMNRYNVSPTWLRKMLNSILNFLVE